MMISVCMATYNGASFVDAQIRSILSQLSQEDEVIVVDDGSKDETPALIKRFNDRRITLIENSVNRGPVGSFKIALEHAKGDYLFLSDQDDVWHPDKVTKVMTAFQDDKAVVVVHDAIVTDQALAPIDNSWNHYNHSEPSQSFVRTLVKNGYTGAMMAFRRDLEALILPFPSKLPMHDWWIALIALKHRQKIVVLPDKLMDYRRHMGSVTGRHRRLQEIVADRFTMIKLLWKR
ncbi:glycosyltransferase family 2 protein [Lacticaseibacillus paracasei]|uniref:Glycosyltransferase family 2 protein n=1 Tax=Lacticaseibacillus paracasei TaxID=1597 RepID=A0ABD5D0E4_LACPA|nr:glycosyltransferase family 2 protein [Lacticaseibacillus paracasei]MDR7625599.1 glycosyltransferase family 2 protein [Lacticaseibacillus paracasei]QPC14820.1 glycosyltransferase family 2 protein [Lacticaseibacillus paracasei subsp. tolerans]QUT00100.1 glycosyltransferase family 2 protein [Lacticaseibacillus paracasei subsp. tolerans]WMX61815.1 glycosyltransferase family 2 protein [Lacticaseibacillus paracasei]